MSEYEQVYNDEPFELKPGKNILKLMCCDCALIHDISIIITKDRKIRLTWNEDRRATAQYRRFNKDKLKYIKNENKKRKRKY